VQYYLAFVMLSADRYDEAATLCEKLPVSYRYKNECLGRARLAQGRTSEAIQILATSDRPLLRAYLGNAYARAGRRDEAEKLAASLAPNPFQEALIYAGLGDKDRTLEALQRMTALGPARVGRALTWLDGTDLRGLALSGRKRCFGNCSHGRHTRFGMWSTSRAAPTSSNRLRLRHS